LRRQNILKHRIVGQGRGSCRIGQDVGAGAGFGAVVVRTGKTVTDTNVMLTEEAEALRCIEVQSVVVAGGVFEVAHALACELAAQVREWTKRVIDARRRGDRTNKSARRALDQIDDLILARNRRSVLQVVMPPAE